MQPLRRADVIAPEIEVQIMKTLNTIEQEHDVTILHAIESGSRAWGFPSPNSDYDVRFLYAHKRDWYLGIYEERDVIELPINEIYDVSGWDLKKTLHLALKSNAVVMEWLQSPIIYKSNDNFTKELNSFCINAFDSKPLTYHYLNLGKRQTDQSWGTSDCVQIKKYFYMIRPALALRWLNKFSQIQAMPMNIQDLMQQSDTPADIKDIINSLIADKQTREEKFKIKRIPALDDFMNAEYERAETRVNDLPEEKPRNIKEANQFFRAWI